MRVVGLWAAMLWAAPGWGVTWFTVNGQTGGSLTLPGALVCRADTVAAGGMLRVAMGIDADGDGALEAGESLLEPLCVRDGAYNDESTQSRVVQLTRTLPTTWLWGRVAVAVIDEDGSVVQHGFAVGGPPAGQTISGMVRDSGGSPVPGAMVAAVPISFAAPESGGYQAFAGPDGTFSMQVPAGQYEVGAGWLEEAALVAPAIYRFGLGTGQSRTGLQFTVDRLSGGPTTISGVLTGPGGEPVVSQIVMAVPTPQTGEMPWTRTDITGAYHLHLPAGTWTVAPQTALFAGYYYPGLAVTVTTPPDHLTVDFPMADAPNVCRGEVGLEGDGPIGGARVGAGSAAYALIAVETNAQGKYVLYLPNGSYAMGVQAPGYAVGAAQMGGCTVPPDASWSFVVHPKTVTVSGRVTRSDTGAGAAFVSIEASSFFPDWEGVFSTRTDGNGYYTISLAAGTWRFELESALLGGWTMLDGVDATTSRTGVNATLPVGNAAISLSGGCVTPQAGPAGGVFTYRVTYTDPQDWPPWQVYAVIDGRPRLMTPVDPGDDDFRDGAAYECRVALGPGEHTFSFGGIETSGYAAGNIVTLPAAGSYAGPTVTVAGDPQVAIGWPANGATVKGVVTVTATATDADGISKVEFSDGGTLRATDTALPYAWSWDTRPLSVPEGLHAISAKAYDTTGHSAQVSIVVNVDNATFDDVPKTSGQWQYVEAIAREGITAGCSQTPPLYCPSSPTTRGQMAVFLCRAAGWSPVTPATPSFSDVPPSNPQYGYIEAMKLHGVTAGCGGGKYCPDSPVTRGQMAVFLCRAAGVPTRNPATPSFADVAASNPQYAYIEGIYAAGITVGCVTTPPKRYCPGEAVTRGQMAVFVCRGFGIGS